MSHYLVRPGDSPSKIALVLTGDAHRWPELVTANPQKKRAASGSFLMLVPGEMLTLPSNWPGVEPTVVDAAGDVAAPVPTPIPWLNREFFERLNEMCARLNVDPYAMILVLYRESSLAPWAFNEDPGTLARGLNQITEKNLRSWGWSDEKIALYGKLSASEQLPSVEKFFGGVLKQFRTPSFRSTPAELYLANFMPARLKPAADVGDSYVLGVQAPQGKDPKAYTYEEKVYASNAGLDANHDGKITAGDLNAEMLKLVRNPRVAWAWSQLDDVRGSPNSGGGGMMSRLQGSPFIATIGALLFFGWASGLLGKAARA